MPGVDQVRQHARPGSEEGPQVPQLLQVRHHTAGRGGTVLLLSSGYGWGSGVLDGVGPRPHLILPDAALIFASFGNKV